MRFISLKKTSTNAAVAKGDPKGLLPAINEAIAKMQSENKLADFITAANELSGKAVDVTADDSAA